MGDAAVAEKPLVLIVEDEPLIRWSAEAMLAEAGFAFLSATNADEAVALLKRHSQIRVVFSDVAMPGARDGAALVLMTRARWPGIGIVLTSGHDRTLPPSLRDRARFISKPYRDIDLIDAVRSVMDG
jgi:DNA-binding NtrC family response regulator